MGQKINPIGFRLALNHNWSSRWFASKRVYAEQVHVDFKIRRLIESKFAQALVSKVEILRSQDVKVKIHCARPGLIIGKKGEEIENLRKQISKLTSINEITVDIRELRQTETDAKLIALNIATQLEKRVLFRRAMRRALQGAERVGVQGIKIMCKGRLNGAEIARFERYHRGRVPLHTLRANIDYGFAEAKTSMGIIGIKVWVFNGETASRVKRGAKLAVEDERSVPVKVGGDDTAEEVILAAKQKAEHVRQRAPKQASKGPEYFDEDDFAEDLDDLSGKDAGT